MFLHVRSARHTTKRTLLAKTFHKFILTFRSTSKCIKSCWKFQAYSKFELWSKTPQISFHLLQYFLKGLFLDKKISHHDIKMLKSQWPLLLMLLTPYVPKTFLQIVETEPTLALKSRIPMSLSLRGTRISVASRSSNI